MNKVFLYDSQVDLGTGQFASIGGFKLITVGRNSGAEAIKDENGKVYGYIYDVNDGVLDSLDMYYGLGLELHERIKTTATLEGGSVVDVYMYEYNMELV